MEEKIDYSYGKKSLRTVLHKIGLIHVKVYGRKFWLKRNDVMLLLLTLYDAYEISNFASLIPSSMLVGSFSSMSNVNVVERELIPSKSNVN